MLRYHLNLSIYCSILLKESHLAPLQFIPLFMTGLILINASEAHTHSLNCLNETKFKDKKKLNKQLCQTMYLLFGWVLFVCTTSSLCLRYIAFVISIGSLLSLLANSLIYAISFLRNTITHTQIDPWTHKSIHISYWQTATKNVPYFQDQIDFRVSVNCEGFHAFLHFIHIYILLHTHAMY